MTRSLNIIMALAFYLAGCRNPYQAERPMTFPTQGEDFGWATEVVDEQAFATIIFVSQEGSDENGDGSRNLPLATPGAALEMLSGISTGQDAALFVASGIYTVNDLRLVTGVHLFGGFDPVTWERNIDANRTILTGGDKGRILLGADQCRIDGFQITGGSFRGNGGAIFCEAVAMEISNNLFIANTTLEPVPWSPEYIHEKAHDGGAVYAGKGASIQVRGNIFWKNSTENGRGAAIAMHGGCKGEIKNNLFLNNTAGIKDQFRSSDGGAVSVFDWCRVDVSCNLFDGNRALNKNDGGALFYALWSSGTVHGNYFFNNQSMDDAGALFVGGQEHRYDAPLDPLPSGERFFVEIDANIFMGNRNPSQNSGAFRITMESRGSFTNNLVAFNNGAYFQRSELEISRNTIVDNLLLIETKEGLNPCRLTSNIILGDVQIETPVELSNCLFAEDVQGEKDLLSFRKDGMELHILGSMLRANRMETRIVSEEFFEANVLKNRILRTGSHFSLIKENRGRELIVYGEFPASESVLIMPTYTPEFATGVMDALRKDAGGRDLYGNDRPVRESPGIGAVAAQEYKP